jgi:DNA-binding NarL/FixJ family response regulator
MQRIDVAVFDEEEIFRRGAVACLSADPLLEIVAEGSTAHNVDTDVALVSATIAATSRLDCPLVVCGASDVAMGPVARIDNVYSVLARKSVVPDQLVNAVRAAAVGLRVQPHARLAGTLDDRSIEVLQLLADGAATREISERMGYSERTIKGIIRDIHLGLGARTRAQAVATALREHLI